MKLHRALALYFTLAAALVAQPLAVATKDSEMAGYMIVETEPDSAGGVTRVSRR